MLHYVMREHGRAWHKAVPFIVWCMREIPSATLGVSPFVMQQQPPFYGHYTGQPALAGTSS